jgi:hypothetical protein
MANTEHYSDDQIKKALTLSKGYISKAAEILGCHRFTISRRLKEKKELREIQHEINEDRADGYELTLHKMAMGEVAYEKEVKSDDGKTVTVIYFTQPPHFPSLKLALEISKRYIPNSKVEHKGQLDIFSEMSQEDDES